MQTVLVANTKGGVGKTLAAVTLAGALAQRGLKVVLADADRQRSSLGWAQRRPKSVPKIRAVDWSRGGDIGEVPKKADWLVIDAPGALKGAKAEALIAEARAVLVPVQPSVFDTTSTLGFLEAIEEIKRVRKGKVPVHLLANRVRPGSRAARHLDTFFAEARRDPVARIGERTAYAELAGDGLTVFDRPQKLYQPLRDQWAPVLAVLE